MRQFLLLFTLAVLAACGTKTPLVLPPAPVPAAAPQAPQPVPGGKAPGTAQ